MNNYILPKTLEEVKKDFYAYDNYYYYNETYELENEEIEVSLRDTLENLNEVERLIADNNERVLVAFMKDGTHEFFLLEPMS